MIKKILLSLFTFLCFTTVKAETENWSLHLSYHNAIHCEIMNNRVYVLASGALYSYSEDTEEINTYDKLSHLSDFNISLISYSKHIDAIVIVYKNANIDIMYSDESVYNIPDFMNKTITNKVINNIYIKENKALLSTSFGIVELDLIKKEFTNTYSIDKNIYAACYYNNSIYAAADDGIICGNISENLLDKNKWQTIKSYKANYFAEYNNKLYCTINSKDIFVIENNNFTKILSSDDNLLYMYSDNGKLVSGTNNTLYTIDVANNISKYVSESNKSNFIRIKGDNLWNCKGYEGLVKAKLEKNSLIDSSNGIIPNSPVRNHCENLIISDDKLLVAGGNINFLGTVFYEPTLMEMNMDYYDWFNYPEESVKSAITTPYNNVCTVDENPLHKGHIFAGTYGTGIYEFKDKEFIKNYTLTNSPLESVLQSASAPRYVRISKVKFDKKGNLWILNSETKSPIKILMNDGSWQNVYYSEIEKMQTPSEIHFDSRGWMWVVSLRMSSGLFCAKTNNTITPDDDETKGWFDIFTNQDGLSYNIYQIYGFAEDKNGKIWVGTDTGLFVIENPNKFFKDGVFTQIKIPRNDGTGLADYLLNGVYIQCIHVDGANRKWIGTKHNGVFLISEDGQETIKNFTTDNSPLPSNNVVSVAVNGKNGEVFIGTDNGIASFMGDATEASEKLDENSVYAYPNPVRSDYKGDISIVGLTFDCNVKIVDTAGTLINEGKSNGGTFVWDGKNKRGERVGTGVYYVLAYDEAGNEGVATKILFMR